MKNIPKRVLKKYDGERLYLRCAETIAKEEKCYTFRGEQCINGRQKIILKKCDGRAILFGM